ncbi:hypothetical protein TIFTF001_005667 [Ficus carica]|uniref:Histone deacetylase domain-containing protein n=1 Tax=Ficus carica TaxID=3494 RepID=A0AA88CYW8_FICCA|nr:hypothetical protein TIFTF001_005667 [Ficus carica]
MITIRISMDHYELIPPSRLKISIESTVLSTLNFLNSKFSLALQQYWTFRSRTMSSSDDSSPSGNDTETFRRDRILSSELYFDVPASKVPLIYSSIYDISFLGIEKLHPFDSAKWGRVCGFLIKDGVLHKNSIVEPLEASKNDLLVVHSETYLNSLKSSANVAMIIEVPPIALFPNCLVQQKVLHPFRNQVGGTILAAKLAKERGWAINVGGGFHHCSGHKGGGFCTYADISLCIQFAFVRLNISSVMIIDLDAHQGNGHETDFANDSRVYILDVFNPGIYPFDYEARRYIDQKVEVPSGTTTDEYLKTLDEALESFSEMLSLGILVICKRRRPVLHIVVWISCTVAAQTFEPELVVYNAGTDILDGDPLGRLRISPNGITIRDEKVFRFARERNVPIVMLTSGGYMKSSARVIADSITNLSEMCLIDTRLKKVGWVEFRYRGGCVQYGASVWTDQRSGGVAKILKWFDLCGNGTRMVAAMVKILKWFDLCRNGTCMVAAMVRSSDEDYGGAWTHTQLVKTI